MDLKLIDGNGEKTATSRRPIRCSAANTTKH